MRKLKILLPVFMLLSGIGGFFIRKNELKTAYDPLTGLSIDGAPMLTVMIAAAAAILALSLLFVIFTPRKYKEIRRYTELFHIEVFAGYLLLLLCGAVITVSGIYYTVTEVILLKDYGLLKTAFGILAAATGIIIAYLASRCYKQRKVGRNILYVLPSIFSCVLLIMLYSENTANPVLTSYCYDCLAYVACALTFYYEIAVIFKKVMPGKLIASYLSASFFEITILAQSDLLPIKLMIGALAVTHILKCGALIRNMTAPSKHKA